MNKIKYLKTNLKEDNELLELFIFLSIFLMIDSFIYGNLFIFSKNSVILFSCIAIVLKIILIHYFDIDKLAFLLVLSLIILLLSFFVLSFESFTNILSIIFKINITNIFAKSSLTMFLVFAYILLLFFTKLIYESTFNKFDYLDKEYLLDLFNKNKNFKNYIINKMNLNCNEITMMKSEYNYYVFLYNNFQIKKDKKENKELDFYLKQYGV